MTRLRTGGLVVAVFLMLLATGCQISMIAKEQPAHGDSPGTFRARWWNYYTRGVSRSDGRQWKEAESDLREAIARRSEDQRRARTYGMHFLDYFPHRELGVVLYHQNRDEEAVGELEGSLKTEKSAKAEYFLDLARKRLIMKSNVDARPPEICLTAPLEDELTNEFSLTVSGVARDDTYVKSLQVNGVAVRIDLAAPEVPFNVSVPLSATQNVIHIAATDLTGKNSVIDRTVRTDWRGPLLSIDEPVEGEPRPLRAPKLRGHAFDESGVARITVNGHDIPITPGTDVQLDHPILPGRDVGMVKVEATDTLGNKTRADIQLQVPAWGGRRLLLASMGGAGNLLVSSAATGKESPTTTIELRDLTDRQTVFLDRIYLEGKARDERGIQSLTVNGLPMLRKPGKNIYFAHLAALNDGENVFLIEAKNAAGGTVEKQVTVERKLPKISQMGSRLSAALLPLARKGAHGPLTEGLDDSILSELVGLNRFVMVERNRLDDVLREQKLGSSELADPDEAVRLGRILAANGVLLGLSVEREGAFEIYMRMVDVETSVIVAAVDVYGEDVDPWMLKKLCQGLVLKLCDELPVAGGIVLEIKGRRFFVDLGKKDRVKKGMRVIVFEEGEPVVHPVTGAVLGSDAKELGQGLIRVVHEQMSDVEVIGKGDEERIKSMQKVITR